MTASRPQGKNGLEPPVPPVLGRAAGGISLNDIQLGADVVPLGAVGQLSRQGGLKEGEKLSGDDVREGLTAVISVKLTDAQFESQTKAKLNNSEIRSLVAGMVTEGPTPQPTAVITGSNFSFPYTLSSRAF